MKRKTLFTIVSMLVLGLGLSSCGTNSSSVSTTTSSVATTTSAQTTSATTTTSAQTTSATTTTSAQTTSVSTTSAAPTYTGISITNKIDLTAAWHALGSDRQILINIAPAGNVNALIADGSLKITSSNSDAVEVNGTYLSAVSAGDAAIVVTLGNFNDSIIITVLAPLSAPDVKSATVSSLVSTTDTDYAYAYTLNATVEKWVGTNTNGTAYGDFYLTDGTKDIYVYGASASASALSFNLSSMTYSFKNPQDFLTNTGTSAIKLNDKLDGIAITYVYKEVRNVYYIVTAVNGTPITNSIENTDKVQAETYNQYYTYEVTGKITAWKDASTTNGTAYGNFYLQTEGATGKALYVYGASATASALTYAAGKAKFTNPKDFLTNDTTKSLAIGDKVTLRVFRCDYTNATTGVTTIEVNGIFVTETKIYTEPAKQNKTITELLAIANDHGAIAYNLTGTVEKWNSGSDGTKYGSLFLSDGTNDILCYGLTATSTALTFGIYTGAYKFSNPNDFLTNTKTKAIAIGDALTVTVIRADYNGTIKVVGIVNTVTPGEAV